MNLELTFERAAPVLPVRDVAAALERYARLGFECQPYEEGERDALVYGFVSWGKVELHLSRFRELNPRTSTSACYLYVSDADALHAKWSAAGVEGRLGAPKDTPYGLREFAYVDPDGNLLRVGSELSTR